MKLIKLILSAFKTAFFTIKLQSEFERETAIISKITGHNENNEKIDELILWYRGEFAKTTNKYPGDQVPIRIVMDYVLKGYTFDTAIKETYAFIILEIISEEKLNVK